MAINAIRAYAPMLPVIKGIKDVAEEGRELPLPVQFIDSVGSGMVAGFLHSHVIFGIDLVKTAKTQFPHEKTSQSVMKFIRRVGPYQFKSALINCRADIFSKGAALGVAFFVVDQGYKASKRYFDQNKS